MDENENYSGWRTVKCAAATFLAVWLVVSFIFPERIGDYLASLSPYISEGEAIIDYYSAENAAIYALNPDEVLSLPVHLEKRLSRIGIYIGEQEANSDKYVFQLEDAYGSILGKTIVSLEDMAKDDFVYIASRSVISNEETYYIKIFSDAENTGRAPLYLNTSPAGMFQTVPFSIEGTETRNTLVLDRRYDAGGKRALVYADLTFVGIVAVIWIIESKKRWWNPLWTFIKKLPWKKINVAVIALLIAADVVLLFAQKTVYFVQYGNERSRTSSEAVVPLDKDIILTQYLQAGEGTADSIGFQFATYMQTVKDGTVHIELWNEDDESKIYSGQIQTEAIADNEYYYFQLDEPLERNGQTLRLRLWAEYAAESNHVAVYGNENLTQTMFAAKNDEPLGKSLIFDFAYRVRLFRTDWAIIITSLLLITVVLYVWAFAPFEKRIFRYIVSSVLLSVLFLPLALSFVNYREVSMCGMTASLNNGGEGFVYRRYSESELTDRMFTETEYDFKGVPFIAYERIELPINGAVSDVKLDYRGNDMVRKDYDIQIYWDTGNGYNENQSYTYKYIHQGGNTLSFPIPCSEPVRSIMLNVGMTSDRFTGTVLPDRILPLTALELNARQAVQFCSVKTAIVFVCILLCFVIAHLWKYAGLDEKLAAFCVRKKVSVSCVFVVISLAFGAGMSFLIPTWQTPDEPAHVSMLFADMGKSTTWSALRDTLGKQGLESVMLNAGQTVDIQAYTEVATKRLEEDEFSVTFPSIRVIRRPGQALGVFAGQVLHLPAYWILQLAELVALVIYTVMGALTLKIIPYKKNLMMLLMLLPVAMQEAGSFSYDSFNNALAFFAVSYILHLKIRAPKVSWKHLMVLALLAMGLLVGKVIYVLLLGLVLTIPLSKLELKLGGVRPITINEVWVKKHRVGVLAGLFVGLCICAWGSIKLAGMLGFDEIDKVFLSYVSSFPQLVRLCTSTCIVHYRILLQGMVAALGNYDVPVNEVVTWTGVLSVFVFALMHHNKLNTQTLSEQGRRDGAFSRWDLLVWYGLFAVLFVIVQMTMISWGFFIYGIDEGLPYSASMRLLPRIEGVQGRYFYPILPLLLIPIHTERDYLGFIPAGLYKFCYYLLMTVYPITLLLVRYWGIGSW